MMHGRALPSHLFTQLVGDAPASLGFLREQPLEACDVVGCLHEFIGECSPRVLLRSQVIGARDTARARPADGFLLQCPVLCAFCAPRETVPSIRPRGLALARNAVVVPFHGGPGQVATEQVRARHGRGKTGAWLSHPPLFELRPGRCKLCDPCLQICTLRHMPTVEPGKRVGPGGRWVGETCLICSLLLLTLCLSQPAFGLVELVLHRFPLLFHIAQSRRRLVALTLEAIDRGMRGRLLFL